MLGLFQLSAREFPGVELLVAVLDENDGKHFEDISPSIRGDQ